MRCGQPPSWSPRVVRQDGRECLCLSRRSITHFSQSREKGTTMALPTNTFATYEAVGNREDLSDVIYRIDPTDTPFMTGIEREKATAVNHEWQTQALAAVDSANAQLEGDDAATTVVTPTVRLGN